MQQPLNLHLAGLLGLAPAPEGLLDWHRRIDAGFPAQTIKKLASETGISVGVLAGAVGVHHSSKKDLSREASNTLYRIASLWSAISGKMSTKAAAEWLTGPNQMMRGRVPLELASSSQGFEYAKVAAERHV